MILLDFLYSVWQLIVAIVLTMYGMILVFDLLGKELGVR